MSRATPILFASSRGDAGAGGETYLLQVMRHLDRARFTPIAVLPWDGTLKPLLQDLEVETHVLEVNYSWLGPDPAWYKFLEAADRRARTLADLIRAKQIGLVHTNSNFFLDAAFAAHLCGVPHLYLAHIEYQPDVSIFERLGLGPEVYAQVMDRLSAAIVAVSDSVAARLSPPVDPQKVTVVHNGVETERFDQALTAHTDDLHRDLGLGTEAVLLTAVGRQARDKGFDLFLQAAARIAPDYPQAHFLIAGGSAESDFEAELKELATAPRLSGRAHLLGFRSDIPEVLAESDIFVLSSRREGHPYVLLEAMAARCAPVATRCQGVDETLTPGEDGLVVPVEDIPAMAEAMARLLKEPQLRRTLAEKAQETIHERFRARDSIAGLMAVYDRILSQPAPLPGDPGIALFLRTCHEIGTLGYRLTEAEERIKYLEGFVSRLRDNPLVRGIRWLRDGLGGAR